MRKILAIGIILLFIVSGVTISNKDITNTKNEKVVASITYRSNKCLATNLQPTVVITQPEDGAVLTDPNLVVLGYASDENGMDYWEWTWEWTGGNYSNSSHFETASYVEFQINITGLHSGWNKITVTFRNVYGLDGSDSVNITYNPLDNEPPEVTIETPSEGQIFTEPDIHVTGTATDNVGVTQIGYIQEWENGSTEDSWPIDSTKYYQFDIEITLHEGLNNITMLASDAAGNEPEHPPIRHVFYKPKEGLLIDAVFQPVQVVYQDDIYGNDLSGGPCVWNAGLDMVAGKNTYLFGYPSSDRNTIKITVHNNYSVDKTFHFVFSKDGEDIWKSPQVTVPAKTKMTFSYNAPIPDTPFQWGDWGDSPKSKDGVIILYPDCGAGPPAECNCSMVTVNVKVKHTHDLNVLFLPFTFTQGPNFPRDLSTPSKVTEFDKWRLLTLEPWWNAIYPLREGGLNTEYFINVKQDITVDGIKVDSLAKLNTLTNGQLDKLQDAILSKALALSWIGGTTPPLGIGGWDRIVLLVHPKIINKNLASNGLAYRILATGPTNGQMKQGVWVNWSTRTKTPAHEISHTYGLDDCYNPGQKSDAVGYWVNEKKDIVNKKDLMWITNSIANSWIKKPNFKSLLKRFNEQRDPEVLGISGIIDKNDSIELNPWYKLEDGYVDLEWGRTGEYSIKAYNENGMLLDETGFNINFTNFMDPGGEIPVNETVFAFRVEWIDGLHRIDIINATSGEILATRMVSPNPPQVSILTPHSEENVQPGLYNITWNAYDTDGDQMTFYVFMRNSSSGWFPVSLSTQKNYFIADFSQPKEGEYQVEVVATDGVNTGIGISETFTILPDTISPTVNIEKPGRALYIFDREIMPFLFPISIGEITIEANASDNVGVSNISFYIDDEMKNVSFESPYSWLWNEKAMGLHKIKVAAYDYAGNTAVDEQAVLIFNI